MIELRTQQLMASLEEDIALDVQYFINDPSCRRLDPLSAITFGAVFVLTCFVKGLVKGISNDLEKAGTGLYQRSRDALMNLTTATKPEDAKIAELVVESDGILRDLVHVDFHSVEEIVVRDLTDIGFPSERAQRVVKRVSTTLVVTYVPAPRDGK